MKRHKNVFPVVCWVQGHKVKEFSHLSECMFSKNKSRKSPTAPIILLSVLVQSSGTGPHWIGPAHLGLRILLYC